MTMLSDFYKFFNTADATVLPEHLKAGETAFGPDGKVVGAGYFPAAMDFSTGYFLNVNFTTVGNNVTTIVRCKFNPIAGNTLHCLVGAQGPSSYNKGAILTASDGYTGYSSLAQGLCRVEVRNSTNALIGLLFSLNRIDDGEWHTIFFSYNGTTGTHLFIIDGVDADDVVHPSRIAPTAATLNSGAGSDIAVGAFDSGVQAFPGLLSFCGFSDVYLTNWSDFMYPDGTPKIIDEIGWTEWGGLQPRFWQESAKMDQHLGSATMMSISGTPKLAAASLWS